MARKSEPCPYYGIYTVNVNRQSEVRMVNMKKGSKITHLCIFVPSEVIFCIATFVALFMYSPVGFVCLAVSALYMLVIISICQSLKGKKPAFNLFIEGTRTCKKCGTTYERAKHFGCPKCAEEKRKNQPPLPTFEEMENARLARKARKATFWDLLELLALSES